MGPVHDLHVIVVYARRKGQESLRVLNANWESRRKKSANFRLQIDRNG